MNAQTTKGRPVSCEHVQKVNALCEELITWINTNGHHQHPAVLMDALINVCLQVADHTGQTQRVAEHLVAVGCQRLLDRSMQRHVAGLDDTPPTRH